MSRRTTARLSRMLALILLFTLFLTALPATAESKTAKNKAAHALYTAIVQKLCGEGGDVAYKYADVTGDGVDELLVEHHPMGNGSGREFEIHTYKSGSTKQILSHGEYGLEKVTRYSKTKALVLYCAGHGSEAYIYFKYKNGKYSLVASKAREAKAGGSSRNGPWSYGNSSGKSIKKADFTKKTNSLLKGSKKIWKKSTWTVLY